MTIKSKMSPISEPTPLVSIVTPSFNAEDFIVETIESVKNQDYPTVEHIIIDGQSQDSTVELLSRYPHLNWVSEPDDGQSSALNKGFKQANGAFIGWLNADDTYTTGTIKKVVAFFQENPDIDIIYSDMQVIDEDSAPIRISKSRSFDLFTLLTSNFVNQPTVFMRRKVVENLIGVNENLNYVMDREFWLRAGKRFSFHYLTDEILANFRFCSGTKSFEKAHEFRAEWIDVLQQNMAEGILTDLTSDEKEKTIRINESKYYIALLVHAINNNQRRSVIKYFVAAIAKNKFLILNPGLWLMVWRSFWNQDQRKSGLWMN